MDEPKLTCITDFIINYLNNVLNINILLVTIWLILLFWAFKASKKEIKKSYCQIWCMTKYHQAAILSDCSTTCTPSSNLTLLTTSVNRLNPLIFIHRF